MARTSLTPDLCRSWLFVGGAEEDALAAVPSCGTDLAILELEDFTPPPLRPQARARAPEHFAAWRAAGVVPAVRVNPFWDGGRDDLAAVMAGRPAVVLLPKVRGPDDVVVLDQAVTQEERRHGIPENSTRLVPNLESAAAVLDGRVIAAASGRVVGMLVASEDLVADLGAPRTRAGEEMAFARAFHHMACTAAGVLAIDCPYTFSDREGLEAHCAAAVALGYRAKSLVQPAQAPAVTAAFTPSRQALDEARRLLAAHAEAEAKGAARVELDGHLVEVPTLRNARSLIARAEALGVA